MSVVMSANEDADIDLIHLFRAIWRKRRMLLLATVAASTLAFGAALTIAPSYKAESRLLIEPRPSVLGGADRTAQDTQPLLDELNIASQVQVLQSVEVLRKVTDDLQLDTMPEFNKTSKLASLLAKIGLGNQPENADKVISSLTEKLQVFQVEKSRVIGIQFTSHDPKLAAEVPNRMMQAYLLLQSGAKLDTDSEATRWLAPEIEKLRTKVAEAERKVADYRAKSDLLQTGDATASFAARQLNDMSTELSRVKTERANAEARAAAVRQAIESGKGADLMPEVMASPIVQRLKENEATLLGQIADLSTTLLDGHPRLKGLRAQLAGLREQIRDEAGRVLQSMEAEARVTALRETELGAAIEKAKADSARAGENEVGLKALEREANAERQLLETYLARYRAAASKTGSDAAPADARIISQALQPTEPSFPKPVPIVVVAGLGTFIFGALAVLVTELLSGRALRPVRRPEEELEPVAPVAALSAVAAPVAKADAAASDDDARLLAAAALADLMGAATEPEETASAGVAEVGETTTDVEQDVALPVPASDDAQDDVSIAAVADALAAGAVRVVAALSPAGASGSDATVALARMLADRGQPTVLVDVSDSGRASLLTVDNAALAGITDLLAADAAFGDTIHQDPQSDVHVIPRGHGDAEQARKGADRLTMVIDALADAYAHVIIDCGDAPIASLERFGSREAAVLVVALAEEARAERAGIAATLSSEGHDDVLFMIGSGADRSGTAQAAA